MTIAQPSHALVRVRDLNRAVADFEKAGFQVIWGSEPARAHNALIHFQQGPFLELFDPIRSGVAARVLPVVARLGRAAGVSSLGRVDRWLQTDGLCDFALEVSVPLAEATPSIAERGIRLGRPLRTQRKNAEGVKLSWAIGSPKDASLPFVMDPYVPPTTILSEARTHPNGARRFGAIRIQVSDPIRYANSLVAFMGQGDLSADGEKMRIEVGAFTFRIDKAEKHALQSISLDATIPLGSELHSLRIEALEKV